MSAVANGYIHQIKTIIVGTGIDAEGISNFLFARLRGIVFKFYSEANKLPSNQENREKTANIALIIFDVFFYFFCIDARPRATYILSQIVSHTLDENQFNDDLLLKEMVLKKLSDEMNMSIMKISDSGNNYGIELINLLHINKQLGKEYKYSSEKFEKIIGLQSRLDLKSLDYFQMISILHYVEDESEYKKINELVCRYIVEYFKDCTIATDNADGFCLMFDFLSCPFVKKEFKQEVVISVYKSINKSIPTDSKVGESINYIKSREWFTSWEDKMDIKSLLEKFELNPAY